MALTHGSSPMESSPPSGIIGSSLKDAFLNGFISGPPPPRIMVQNVLSLSIHIMQDAADQVDFYGSNGPFCSLLAFGLG
jgi:hypothetical protein